MCKIIAVANHKGGVAKTTSTVNIGIGLARMGQKVLLVDSDAQGSLTSSLGFKDTDSIKYTIAKVFDKTINEEKINPEEGILHHEEGVDLMPSSLDLSVSEANIFRAYRCEYILKEYLDGLRKNYDWIIIDCPPSLGKLMVNDLVAADSVVIPVKPYKEKVRASYCWCGGKLKRKPRRVKCLPLFYQIYKMMQWDINARYRITGEIEDSGEEKIIFFDLDDAVCFVREKGSDNNAAGTTENGRTPKYHMQMPSEWEKHYGMPVMDFDTRQDVKTFGDMAVFDVTFELNKEIVRTENEKTETEKGAREENNGKIENSGNVENDENDEKRGNCL